MKIINNNKNVLMLYLLERLLSAYNEDGTLAEDYYNNIILPELTEEEYKLVKETVNGGAK